MRQMIVPGDVVHASGATVDRRPLGSDDREIDVTEAEGWQRSAEAERMLRTTADQVDGLGAAGDTQRPGPAV
jgi:hypothetical protein